MKRLYSLTHNIQSTENISRDLHEAGITDWNFHVISKNEQGLERRHIHSANILQRTDLVHSMEKSILYGVGIGLLVALVISQIPVHGSTPSLSVLIGIFIAGIVFGAWHGTLFGFQNENIKLKPFHDRIEDGYDLIMVDVYRGQLEQVKAFMARTHPEARLCTEDNVLVNPFEQPKEVQY